MSTTDNSHMNASHFFTFTVPLSWFFQVHAASWKMVGAELFYTSEAKNLKFSQTSWSRVLWSARLNVFPQSCNLVKLSVRKWLLSIYELVVWWERMTSNRAGAEAAAQCDSRRSQPFFMYFCCVSIDSIWRTLVKLLRSKSRQHPFTTLRFS